MFLLFRDSHQSSKDHRKFASIYSFERAALWPKMQKLTTLLALASAVDAASLKDVKHVVMLMMENRSFQHVSLLKAVVLS